MSRGEAAPAPAPVREMFFARVWYDLDTGQKHYDIYNIAGAELAMNVLANHQQVKEWHMQQRKPRAWKPSRALPRMSMWGAAAIDYTPESAMRAARREAGEIK